IFGQPLFGREAIRLYAFHDGEKEEIARWSPVAALLDWSARPEFWDDQAIILVEHTGLKRLLLADAVRAQCTALADKSATTPADRDALKRLATDTALSASKLTDFLKGSQLTAEDRKGL